MQYSQHMEAAKLHLDLLGQAIPPTFHYHKIRRTIRTELQQALVNDASETLDLVDQADKYLTRSESTSIQSLHAITHITKSYRNSIDQKVLNQRAA